MSIAFLLSTQGLLQYSKLCGEFNKYFYAVGQIAVKTSIEYTSLYL
jgi:hypothetical protein